MILRLSLRKSKVGILSICVSTTV
ncbi:MAG: YSIRK-type signal peptide-containing protein [Oscillospiraceae bacterium]